MGIGPLIKKAKKFLKSAENLLKLGDFDSSVSRTYYSMFYSVEAILLTKNLKYKSHRGVISAFGEHFIKTNIFSKEMSDQLRNAMDKRNEGDYEYETAINKEEAKKLLQSGQEFVKIIIDYLKNNSFL